MCQIRSSSKNEPAMSAGDLTIDFGHALFKLRCLPPPSCQDLFDFAGDLQARVTAVHTSGQQLIVGGVVVANCGANRQGQCFFIQISPRLRTANATAAPECGMFGDGSHFARRTSREQLRDQLDHPRNQFAVLFASLQRSPCPRRRSLPGILNAFLLGLFQRGIFH